MSTIVKTPVRKTAMSDAHYKTQSRDTSAKVERILIEAYQRMSPQEKMSKIAHMSQACTDLAIMGIRQRHPHADEQEIRLRLGALRLERETMIKAFGCDPKKEGY